MRWHAKTPDQKGEPFVYYGLLRYLRHQGAKPMRVGWRLEQELPAALWNLDGVSSRDRIHPGGRSFRRDLRR